MDKKLLVSAVSAMNKSYSPYSGFRVGAALLCSNGKIYTGCNIENASYSLTVCAERTALLEAVKCGERDFVSICIIGGRNGQINDFCYPCGACLQTLSEFCTGDFKIILHNGIDFKTVTLDELKTLDNPVIFGNINLSSKGLKKLPDMSNVTLYGDFLCQNNALNSLKGIPNQINGKLNCARNKIKSLRHMPKCIGDGFDCSHNKIKDLRYLSDGVAGDINCSYNELVDLSYGASECTGVFNCSNNKIINLGGHLDVVYSTFDCSYNLLVNLDDMPSMIYGDMICKGNKLPENFKVPGNVQGDIISDNKKPKDKQKIVAPNTFTKFLEKITSQLLRPSR